MTRAFRILVRTSSETDGKGRLGLDCGRRPQVAHLVAVQKADPFGLGEQAIGLAWIYTRPQGVLAGWGPYKGWLSSKCQAELNSSGSLMAQGKVHTTGAICCSISNDVGSTLNLSCNRPRRARVLESGRRGSAENARCRRSRWPRRRLPPRPRSTPSPKATR